MRLFLGLILVGICIWVAFSWFSDHVDPPRGARQTMSLNPPATSPAEKALTPKPTVEQLSYDEALDQCMDTVRQHFPKLSVWPGTAGLEESSRRLYQQNGRRFVLFLEFDTGIDMEGSGVATCDVQTSKVILKSVQLGIMHYDFNDDGNVAQESGWSGWQNVMQPIHRVPQSDAPAEASPNSSTDTTPDIEEHASKTPPILEFTAYKNDRFGFSIDYPQAFVPQSMPPNAEDITFASPNGESRLVVAARNNLGRLSLGDYLRLRSSDRGRVLYKKAGSDWFVIVRKEGDKRTYLKMFVGSGSVNSFAFTFPESEHEYWNALDRIETSFKPGDTSQAW